MVLKLNSLNRTPPQELLTASWTSQNKLNDYSSSICRIFVNSDSEKDHHATWIVGSVISDDSRRI